MASAVDPRSPCIIGVAQHTVRPGEGPSPEPLELWERVVREASADAGQVQAVLDAVHSLQIVYCQSWPYDDPVARLAGRLGISPRHRLYSGIGGTTPQVLVQEAAESILAGHCDVAVVTGAEALETLRQAKKAGERVPWSHRDPQRKPFPFEAPFHPAEVAHEVFQAWLTFPLWDVARRARLGVGPDDYRHRLGEVLAPMTEVAAANPHAWFPLRRSASELITPTSGNRMVGYPYTKYMVSVMDVDMAAALVIASHEKADDLGIPADRRVYLRGWCYATDPVYVAEHDPLWASPAMAAASATAMRAAGVTIDDVAHLDLYSCFASTLNLACDALGIDPRDPRGLTVTGGLPFSGGAGSDYMTHSIATMVDVLRQDPGSIGMVSGVGMHLTKHVYAVYSTDPGRRPPRPPDAAAQAAPGAGPSRVIRDVAAGSAEVATYTVAHGRGGGAEWGLAVCDLPEGERCYARIEDADLLAEMEATEWIGATVDLVPGAGNVNLVKP
jgi:acetyl-CoA C-acetyltransferase